MTTPPQFGRFFRIGFGICAAVGAASCSNDGARMGGGGGNDAGADVVADKDAPVVFDVNLDPVANGLDASTEAGDALSQCPFAACGGDVVGTWEMVTSCGEDVQLEPQPIRGCDDDSTSTFSYRLQEAIEVFEPDGTYRSRNAPKNVRQHLDLGPSCLAHLLAGADAGAPSCAQIQQVSSTQLGQEARITCADSGNRCACEVVVADPPALPDTPLAKAGTWRVRGNLLITTMARGNTLTRPYCVRDGMFHLQDAWLLSFRAKP